MSPMALLLLLLVLAYIGGMGASPERKRAFGSPSGIEYVVLGLLLGPEALAVLGNEAMQALEPIAIVALGWVGLLFGLECGIVDERSAAPGRIAAGLAFTIATAIAAAFATFHLLVYFDPGPPAGRLPLCAAIGLVTAETTRHAVRWLGERQPLSGPLADLLRDLGAADDAPVLLALAVLFAQLPGERTAFDLPLSPIQLAGLTIAASAALGVLTAWLLGHAGDKVERWTILLGAAWLITGMARSLGLSALAGTFTLGLTLRAVSPDAAQLRALLSPTEGAVLLPALMLGGAHLTLPASGAEVAIIGGALGVRLVMSLAFGYLLSFARSDTRGLGPWLGAGMLASGTLTMIVAFGIALNFPPDIGRPALLVAFLGTLLGEVIGPAALRHAFGRASAPPPPPTTGGPSELEQAETIP